MKLSKLFPKSTTEIVVMDNLRDEKPEMFREDGSMKYEIFERDIRPNKSVYIRHDKNSVSFTIREGCGAKEMLKIAIRLLREETKDTYNYQKSKAASYVTAAIEELELAGERERE